MPPILRRLLYAIALVAMGATGVGHTAYAVELIATTVVVTTVSPATIGYRQSVAVTVSVTAASGGTAPDGGVGVSVGPDSCNATLAPAGGLVATGSCNISSTGDASASAYAVHANYPGNATFAASNAENGSLTVNKALSRTDLISHTPDPSVINAPIAVTAVVSAYATGTITVSDGAVNCTITLPASNCNLTPTTTGAKLLTATYSGDTNYYGSGSGVSQTVYGGGTLPTTTSVTNVNPGTIVYGQWPVVVTVSVTAASGSSAPDGSVEIFLGPGPACTATLAPAGGLSAIGTCTFSGFFAPPSSYTIGASYLGTATFAHSSANNGSVTVTKANTSTAITAHTPSPSNVGAAIAVWAAVSVVPPGGGTLSGTVTVSDGSITCTIALPASNCNLMPTTPGAKSLTATYDGSGIHNGSVSAGVAHTVNPGGSTPTAVSVTNVNPGTIVYGQSVAVTATVTAGAGAVSPNGTVVFSAGPSACNATLVPAGGLIATGTCTLAPSVPAHPGAYTVTASYLGNATFAASTATNGSLTVNMAAQTTTITAHTPNPSHVYAPIAVIAIVSVTPPGGGAPTGYVSVTDGSGGGCSIKLPATSCNLVPTTPGSKSLRALYAGDGNYKGFLSDAVEHTVLPPATTFTAPTTAAGVTGTATLSGGGATCGFANPVFVAPQSAPPPGVAFPFGVFSFSAVGCTPGAMITVQIDYSLPLPPGTQYWKYGPTAGNASPHWYLTPGASVAGTTATFVVTDGQVGDDDLATNGTIVDAGGPGAPSAFAAPSEPIPTLSNVLLALLALALAVAGRHLIGDRSQRGG